MKINPLENQGDWRNFVDEQTRYQVEEEIGRLESECNQLEAKVKGMEALVRKVRDAAVGAQISQTLKDQARELVPL